MKASYLFLWNLILLIIAVSLTQAKVLIVVDSDYYNIYGKSLVDRYVNEITTIDKKQTELIIWSWDHNNKTYIRDACYPLWQTLQQKYIANRHVLPTDQDITGAVFIGQLPIPKFEHVNGTGFYPYPHDYYFMDLWNQNTSTPYPSDTTIWQYRPDLKAFYGPSYESNGYKYSAGDCKLDIWMTRICAEHFDKLYDTNNVLLEEHDIINQYLDRVHDRMTKIAKVPSRSLSFGCANGTGPDSLQLELLGLPFHTSFDNVDNVTAPQLVAQLQDGPRGNCNRGAYNGEVFPYFGNAFYCVRTSLYNKNRNMWENDLDTRGYEWVGLKGHGNPHAFTMFSPDGSIHPNGYFKSFTTAPFIGYPTQDARGINGEFIQFSNLDLPEQQIGGGLKQWNELKALWKVYMPVKGKYDIYMNYPAEQQNA